MPTSRTYRDLLRLNNQDVTRILRQLDERDRHADPGLLARRAEARYDYRKHPVLLIDVTNPDRSVGKFRCATRNISRHGLGFLHGCFVYPKSPVKLILRAASGGITCIAGTVARCEAIEGRVHEIGVIFDQPVDLTDFVLDVDPAQLEQEVAEA